VPGEAADEAYMKVAARCYFYRAIDQFGQVVDVFASTAGYGGCPRSSGRAALMQNLRRGDHELAVEEPATRRVAVAFDGLALVI
jgi:hypothetical protein